MKRTTACILFACLLAGAFSVEAQVSSPLPLPSQQLLRTIRLQYDTTVTRGTAYGWRVARRPTLALVLSGGGSRGAAQIGVLKAIERHHIPVDFISATSMGAIIGGLYASGYSVAEIESITIHTNWDDILSLADETSRSQLFIDQKLARDRSFLAVRFEGLAPVIPSAVASGQRLTDWLRNESLQALYHADPSFDDLKIPFRAIATDLVSGRRVVEERGSLAEAIRASATTPLLFSPIEKDSMRLVDGGILANVPVDVARERGTDLVVAINTTSGLRGAEEMKAPWETVDQLMSISMQILNSQQLRNADVVITPNIGRHLTFDMHGLDTLITRGEVSAEAKIPEILRLLDERANTMDTDTTTTGPVQTIRVIGEIPDSLRDLLQAGTPSSGRDIRRNLRMVFEAGMYADVSAELGNDSHGVCLTYRLQVLPTLRSVDLAGCRLLAPAVLQGFVANAIGKPFGLNRWTYVSENILRAYRSSGYSLARVDSMSFDPSTGRLWLDINEGVIDRIDIEGGVRTEDEYVLKEFQLRPGEVFRIDRANRGVENIMSTTLFEYVYLQEERHGGRTSLTIRLRERQSRLVRLGVRIDNERHLQGLVDFRDENFQGAGMELGLTLSGGSRNADATLEYKMKHLFGAYLTLSANAFVRTYDSYLFGDAVTDEPNTWRRVQIGEYQDIRYGGSVGFSSQFERLGNASLEFTLQDVRLTNLQNAQWLEERHRLVSVKVGTVVDSKNAYPFPTKGVGLSLSYEFAVQGLGSDVGYNAMSLKYEWFSTWSGVHTIHPCFTMDFADRTMPLSQQFRLGGLGSFFGVRDDDRRGRQLILLNFEYRFFLPVRLLFDTYVRVRYDVGSISDIPEEIKLSSLHHGIGADIAWKTPFGPAVVGAGESFFAGNGLPNAPLQRGPLLWYFSIGYEL